jgi:hypothetical protein
VPSGDYLNTSPAAAGVAPARDTGWANSAYTEVLASASADIELTGWTISLLLGGTSTFDSTYEGEIDIAVGAASSEVVVATIPFAFREDNNTGHFLDIITSGSLPEPRFVSSGSRLAVRLRFSSTTGLSVTALKIAYRIAPPSGTPYAENPNDSVTMSDSVTFELTKGVADTVGLADDLQRVLDYVRTPADSVTMSDSLSTAKEIPLAPADSVSLSDAIVFSRTISLDETLPLTDSVAFQREVTLQDAVSLVDAVALSYGLSAGDVVTLSDLADPQLTGGAADLTVNVDDSVTVSDALSMIREVAHADSVGLADALAMDRGLIQSDSVSLADSASTAKDIPLNPADSVVISDDVSLIRDIQRLIEDDVALNDLVVFDRGILKAENLSVSDVVVRRLNGVILEDGSVGVVRQGVIYIGRF